MILQHHSDLLGHCATSFCTDPLNFLLLAAEQMLAVKIAPTLKILVTSVCFKGVDLSGICGKGVRVSAAVIHSLFLRPGGHRVCHFLTLGSL